MVRSLRSPDPGHRSSALRTGAFSRETVLRDEITSPFHQRGIAFWTDGILVFIHAAGQVPGVYIVQPGLIANLDLVVSVQNSLVHLCGALGKTCLAMLPANAEWRYGIAGDRMAWYDSVRLYRRAPEGSWADVVAEVGVRLRARKG